MSKIVEIDGRPVKDARRSMPITITKEDVKAARRKRPDTCAIAQTCMRQPGVKEVRIHLTRAYVRKGNGAWERLKVPRNLRSEIIAFDRGGRFAPGEYVLYKISPSDRYQARPQREPGPRTGKRKVRKMHYVTDVRSGPA